MARKWLLSLILIPVLLGSGVGVFELLVATAPKPPTSVPIRPVLLVEAERVTSGDVVESIFGYGTAQADRRAWIMAQVAGVIVELPDHTRVGAAVKAEDLLLRIDDRDYAERVERARSMLAAEEAALRRLDVEEENNARLISIAESELQIADREYERVRGLDESGNARPRELDLALQARQGLRRACQTLYGQRDAIPQNRAAQQASRDRVAAELRLAELELERCAVRATFDGEIASRSVDLGERVAVGQSLVSVLSPDRMEVPIELPLSIHGRVSVGAPCKLRMESNQQVVWQGEVTRIAPAADEATRTFQLFVEVDNRIQPQPLLAGAFVQAEIEGPLIRDVVTLPREAVVDGYVFLLEERTQLARRVPVTVERTLRERVALRGVQSGSLVVLTNLDVLADGLPVRVGEPSNEPTESEAGARPVQAGGAPAAEVRGTP